MRQIHLRDEITNWKIIDNCQLPVISPLGGFDSTKIIHGSGSQSYKIVFKTHLMFEVFSILFNQTNQLILTKMMFCIFYMFDDFSDIIISRDCRTCSPQSLSTDSCWQ